MTNSEISISNPIQASFISGQSIDQKSSKAPKSPKAPKAPKASKAEITFFVPDAPKVEIIDPKALLDATNYIAGELSNVSCSFLRIGYKLRQVRDSKAYQVDGHKNVYEYGEDVFGFKKTSVVNFIQVCEKFSLHDSNGNPTFNIAPEFCNYSYTQLTVLATLPPVMLTDINPDMSVSEIKKIKGAAALDSSISSLDSSSDSSAVKIVCIFSKLLTDGNFDAVCDQLLKCVGKRVNITVEKEI